MKGVGWIVLTLLGLLSFSTEAQLYFEPGFGAGIWHESHVLNATSTKMPLQASLEVGSESIKYSLTGLYDFHSSYAFENYQLNPSFAGMFINRLIFELPYDPVKVQFLGSVGGIYELHRFIDNGNANVPGYELEEEKKQGIGFAVRLVTKLEYRNLVFSPQLQMFRSNQRFTAGQFESQSFQTGSNRIVISLTYKFRINENPTNSCPTYY